MNETSLQESPITWPDLAVAATFPRVSSPVDLCLRQAAPRECTTFPVVRDSLSELVKLDLWNAPGEQVLLAAGSVLPAHSQVRGTGRANQ